MPILAIDLTLGILSIGTFIGTCCHHIWRRRREGSVAVDVSRMKRFVKRKVVELSLEEMVDNFSETGGEQWQSKKRSVGKGRDAFLEVKQREKKAEVALRRGELAEAEKYLVEALSFDPGNQDINKKLALLYLRQQRYPKAELIYLRLAEQGTKDPTVYSNLGLVLYHEGRLDLAIQSYQKAIELDPKRPARFANVGQIYYELQDLKNAILNFEQAYLLNKRETDYMFILAKLYEEVNLKEKAKFYYHKVLDVDPYNAEAKSGIQALL